MPETRAVPQMSISSDSPNLAAIPQGFAARADGMNVRDVIAELKQKIG